MESENKFVKLGDNQINMISEFLDKEDLLSFSTANKKLRNAIFRPVAGEEGINNLKKIFRENTCKFESIYKMYHGFFESFERLDICEVIWGCIKKSEQTFDNFKKLLMLVNWKARKDTYKNYEYKIERFMNIDPKNDKSKIDMFGLLPYEERTFDNLFGYFFSKNHLKNLSDENKASLLDTLNLEDKEVRDVLGKIKTASQMFCIIFTENKINCGSRKIKKAKAL